MDEKLRETTNLGVEIMNSKRQVKRMVGHVVQIRVCRLTAWKDQPCKNKVFSLNHSKRAKILLHKVAKFYTDVFMVGGKFVPPPPSHYTNVCVKFRHFVRAVPCLVSIKLKLIILRVFFFSRGVGFSLNGPRQKLGKSESIWVHLILMFEK